MLIKIDAQLNQKDRSLFEKAHKSQVGRSDQEVVEAVFQKAAQKQRQEDLSQGDLGQGGNGDRRVLVDRQNGDAY